MCQKHYRQQKISRNDLEAELLIFRVNSKMRIQKLVKIICVIISAPKVICNNFVSKGICASQKRLLSCMSGLLVQQFHATMVRVHVQQHSVLRRVLRRFWTGFWGRVLRRVLRRGSNMGFTVGFSEGVLRRGSEKGVSPEGA